MKRKERVRSGSLPAKSQREPGEIIYLDDGTGYLQQYLVGSDANRTTYPVMRPNLLAVVEYQDGPDKTTSLAAKTYTPVPFNVVNFNNINGLTLDTDSYFVAIPAGTYKIRTWVQTYATTRVVAQIRINEETIKTSQGYSSSGAESFCEMNIVVTSSDIINVQVMVYSDSAQSNYGYGVNNGLSEIEGARTLSELIIERV